MSGTPTDLVRFIEEHTEVGPVELLPEVQLRQATESFRLWETTERELADRGVALPYWAFPWAGGVALARHLLDDPALVAGRRVLDLGCGSGLVGIAAALAGASEVTANDIDPLALEAVALNANANAVAVRTLAGDLSGEAEVARGLAEVVLAGDVAYERTMSDGVFALLTELASDGVDVLVGDPGRAYFPSDRGELRGEYDVPVSADLDDTAVKRVNVWRIRG